MDSGNQMRETARLVVYRCFGHYNNPMLKKRFPKAAITHNVKAVWFPHTKHKRVHTFKIRLLSDQGDLWPVSRKSRKLFGPRKPFLKLRLAHSVKLVFSYVVKRRKIKKRTVSPEMGPKRFGTFEKRAAGLKFCLFSYPFCGTEKVSH